MQARGARGILMEKGDRMAGSKVFLESRVEMVRLFVLSLL